MSQQPRSERIAFIGGYGHHCLRGALDDPAAAATGGAVISEIEAVAVTSDGRDDEATKRKFAPLLDSGRAVWFDEPTQMYEAFKPTVVNVGGVYGHNADVTVEALQRDIPVVSEKPIAATWEQLSRVREATAGGRRILLTEFTMRTEPAFRAAREAVQAGEIGQVVLATAQKSYRFGDRRPAFYRRRADYGSTLLWVASHGIDFTYFASGQVFTGVCGSHNNLSRPDFGSEFEDHAAVVFTLQNGGTAVVHADFLRPDAAATHGDDRLRLAGDKGVIEVRDGRCLLTTNDRPERDITGRGGSVTVHGELLGAVRQGGNATYNTAASLQIAEVLLAARDAADTGRWIAINSDTTMTVPDVAARG